MRKRRIVATGVVSTVAALAVGWFFLYEKEPSANGHPLSYWVLREGHPTRSLEEKVEADASIRKIGTNALPFLLNWSQQKASSMRKTIWRLSFRLPTWWIADRIRATDPDVLAVKSWLALRILGPQAAPIIPELTYLLTNAPLWDSLGASSVLGAMGTNALPALMSALQNPSGSSHRGLILAAIRDIHPPPDMAAPFVPVLIRCLGETNFPETAALTLGSLAADPESAVPALIQSLENSNTLVRLFTARTLTNFPEYAALILPALTNRLYDTSPAIRTAASNSIRTFFAQPIASPSR